jgi:lipopolysaccharide/colanic/teichoic acid biosynthesis glycosyltransferase
MTDSFYVRTGKRWFDAVAAFVGIVLLAPIFLVLGLLVLFTSGWPIVFRQERTGLNGRMFLICKFRTMTNGQSATETPLTSATDARITPFGKWLRRAKCDELPQLFNVLKGEMSMVGPRPEVPYFTQKFTTRQCDVLKVRPGITGPAATEYISEEQLLAAQPNQEAFYLSVLLPAKLEKDLLYAEGIAFNTDLKLIANTLVRLLVKSPQLRKLSTDAPRQGI